MVTQHADSRRVDVPAGDRARAAARRGGGGAEPGAPGALRPSWSGCESKVEVIPFGIDQTRWEMVPPPPPGGAPRAIFIGRLVAYKGLDILLRALERVPELRLDVVGSGPEGPRLRTLAQALAITDRVRWYGEYPDEDLPRRMADADFLVLPSVTVEEMFGLVVLEAMAAGRPVITTALPSAVREVNVPGVTGLEVPLRDVPALAQALETLSHDPARRRSMGEAGRRRVQRAVHPDRDGGAAHRAVRANPGLQGLTSPEAVRGHMTKFRRPSGPERQARLKPQFASLYPGVVAGEWIPAWLLAEQLMNTAEQRGVAAGGRVCDPAHCEFRGGGQRTSEFRNLRTRVADHQ